MPLRTGLEFAPGTTDDCKKIVGKLFTPTDILGAYRAAREMFQTGDLVLVASESDPSGFSTKKRSTFVKELKAGLNGKPMPFIARALVDKPAHSIVQMPFSSDAMWLVITRHQGLPIMVVIYATPYEVAAPGTSESDMVTLN
jgi:hypothetical protein